MEKKTIAEFLMWIVGAKPSFNQDVFEDIESLLKQVKKHRLTILCNEVVNSTQLHIPQDFKNLISELSANDQTFALQQINIVKAINDAGCLGGFPIKGIIPYLLTSDVRYMKHSNDIDYVSSNNELLEEAINKIGGTQLEKAMSAHEDALYLVEDKYIEAHNSFPCINLPPHFSKATTLAQGINTSFISYHKMKSYLSWNEQINGYIPSIELTVLIAILHIYKDYYWEPYKIPRIRLMDLYTVYRLIGNTLFSRNKFLSLVAETNSADAVEFVSTIIYDIWGIKPLVNNLDTHLPIMHKTANGVFGCYVSIDKNFSWENVIVADYNDIIGWLDCNKIKVPSKVNLNELKQYNLSSTGYMANAVIEVENDIDENVVVKIRKISDCPWRSVMIGTANSFGHIYFDHDAVTKQFGFNDLMQSCYINNEAGKCLVYTVSMKSFQNINNMVVVIEQIYRGDIVQTTIPLQLSMEKINRL